MSGGRTGSRIRTLRSPEAVRLAIAAVLAGGAVLLAQSLAGGHHRSNTPARQQAGTAGAPSAEAGAGSGGAPTQGAGHQAGGSAGSLTGATPGAVTAAGGPAVTRSLRRGSMTVVIDQPGSGLFSEQNVSITRGATTAVDELNAAGGLSGHVRIKLLSQRLDGLSATALQRRLRSEAAAALILPCDTDSQLSLAAGAAADGTLMFAPCNPDPTAGRRYPTYWPVGMGAGAETAGLAQFMHTYGYRSAFLINATGSRYTELISGYFRSAAQARGVALTGSASIATTGGDAASLARAIQASRPKPAALFTAMPPPFVNRLAAQLQAQGIRQPLVGTAAMDTRLSLSSGGNALENAILASYGFPREDASARRFERDYGRR